MLVSTCTAMRNALIQFVLGNLDAACSVGDARAVSCVLEQTWSIETGVHEAGVRALLTMISATMPNTKKFIACAPDGSIFNVPFDLAIELDCAAEECLRIACWEHGGLAVIASMEVFRIVCVCVCLVCVLLLASTT